MLVPAGNTVPTELRVAGIFLCLKIEHMIKAHLMILERENLRRSNEKSGMRGWRRNVRKNAKSFFLPLPQLFK